MTPLTASASPAQDKTAPESGILVPSPVGTSRRSELTFGSVSERLLTSLSPRPYQIEAATTLDHAIWAPANSRALLVTPVASGKTLILVMVACLALNRGCERLVVVSRARHIAEHCLDTLAGYVLHLGEEPRRLEAAFVRGEAEISAEDVRAARRGQPVSGGLYTGRKKQSGQIVFATVQTLARHVDVVESADLVLMDECDQAYVRETTKEYSAVLKAARRYAGVTGTPFVLEKGRTVPIFGRGA